MFAASTARAWRRSPTISIRCIGPASAAATVAATSAILPSIFAAVRRWQIHLCRSKACSADAYGSSFRQIDTGAAIDAVVVRHRQVDPSQPAAGMPTFTSSTSQVVGPVPRRAVQPAQIFVPVLGAVELNFRDLTAREWLNPVANRFR